MATVARKSRGGSKPGERRGGRKPGTPNRLTSNAKEAIALAAEGLGGSARLILWAQEDPANERAFWTSIYPKLVPHEVTGRDGGPIEVRKMAVIDASGKSTELSTGIGA